MYVLSSDSEEDTLASPDQATRSHPHKSGAGLPPPGSSTSPRAQEPHRAS